MLFNYIAKLSVYTFLLYIIIGIIYLTSFNNSFFLYLVNFITTLTYFSFLLWFSQGKINIKTNALLMIVFVYSLFFVAVYNTSFFIDHGNFFAFGSRDSMQYHSIAKNMAATSFSNAFDFLPAKWNFDDYGFPIYVSLLYRIFDTPLIVNLVNVLLNTFTTYFIYKIGRYFLTNKYACVAALVFGLSTYSIYYQTSGLKETLMIFLITGSFHYYYKYLSSNRKKYFLYAILWCMSVFFFRVPLVFFLFLSILCTEFFRMKLLTNLIKMKFSYKFILPIFITITVSIIFLYTKFPLLGRYLSLIKVISLTKQSISSSHSFVFVYLNSFMAGFLGPFPTIIPLSKNMNLSILAGSLILKVFLSIYFIFGVYIGRKNKFILPIAIFCLLEICSLSYVLQSFEFRKCYPHIPFVILIAIYGFQYLNYNKCKYYLLRRAIWLYNSAITVVMFYWHYLRI